MIIKILEDKGFLLAKREKGQHGVMAGVDVSLRKKEKAQAKTRRKQIVFGVGVYVKSWFLSRLPTAALANDLRLLKLLVDIDSPAAKGALMNLCSQLWYLSEDLMPFSFFD